MLVWLSDCSAIIAPILVFTEFRDMVLFSCVQCYACPRVFAGLLAYWRIGVNAR